MKKAVLIFGFLFLISASSTFAQTGIRKVNFRNFTYKPLCVAEKPFAISVKNGKFLQKEESGSIENYLHFWVQSINYGDLDGDKKDEAVIITVCHTGGTGKFSEGYIYSIKNNKPVLKGRIAGGDRASGGLVSAKIEKGLLIVESNEEGGGGLCCPEFIVTNKFRLSNNKLSDFGKSTRRELYPANRISFPKGASELTFQTEIGYRKRFVVTARKGQMLYVKVNQKDSPIYIREGNADSIKNGNSKEADGLIAKLNDDGDFVFDVNNNNEGSLIYTITVVIK